MMKRLLISSVLFSVAAGNAFAGTCYVNGSVGLTGPISSATHLGHVVCGNLVEGSTCVLNIDDDATGSAGTDCLTVGRGVIVHGKGHTFTCPASTDCGTAITFNATGSTGSNSIEEVTIAGHWNVGMFNYSGSVVASATDVNITGADTGMLLMRPILRANIQNTSWAIWHNNSAASVADSLLKGNDQGIYTSADNTSLTNSLVIDNYRSFRTSSSSNKINVTSSVLRDATDCHCVDYSSTCQATTFCVDYTGEQSFEDDTFQ